MCIGGFTETKETRPAHYVTSRSRVINSLVPIVKERKAGKSNEWFLKIFSKIFNMLLKQLVCAQTLRILRR